MDRNKLLNDFLKAWPLKKLSSMTLDQYAERDEKRDSFCFWLESKTFELGSIWGGSAYKFQIYKCRTAPNTRTGQQSDGKYAWNSKHGNTANEVFEKVRAAVCEIATNAAAGNFKAIDEIDVFGGVCKWKIAFLYSHKQLIPIYSRDKLVPIAAKQGIKNCEGMPTSKIQEALFEKKGDQDLFVYSDYLLESINYSEEVKSYAELLKSNYNLVLTGAPGTGKTFAAKKIAEFMKANCELVQFHPSYDYTDFVEGLRPVDTGDGIGFERKDGVFKEFCKRALRDVSKKKPYVFIIDEINRGEISKIFGELFYSIDRGYRGEEGRVKTQYQNLVPREDPFYEGFYVPNNVYIIGTMNDIDRSVESIDFAMRRRFAWVEFAAKESQSMFDSNYAWGGAKKPKNIDIDKIKARMDRLNECIVSDEIALTRAYQIGAAYFLKYALYNDFDTLWKNHLKGVLYEYLRGAYDIDKKIDLLHKAYDGNSTPTQSDKGIANSKNRD